MEQKVVIIGCGNVGSTVAYTLYNRDICNILLINHNKCRADSNVLDILDSSIFHTYTITSGDYCDIDTSDIVIVCAGDSSLLRSGNRLSEFENSKRIANDIISNLNKIKFNGIIINVMNPCDEVTNLFRELNISKERIIGTGTLLETVRLRRIVYEQLGYCTSAFVVGMHGTTNAIVSKERIPKNILNEVHNRVWKIYEGKGFTNFGVANIIDSLVHSILFNDKQEFCVSTLCCGVYGFTDKAISVPCIIGNTGITKVPLYPKVSKILNKLFT